MITFNTGSPHQLLTSLKEAIRKGHITTWSDINGDFTHTPNQWAYKAWFRPSIQGNELRFAIIKPQNITSALKFMRSTMGALRQCLPILTNSSPTQPPPPFRLWQTRSQPNGEMRVTCTLG